MVIECQFSVAESCNISFVVFSESFFLFDVYCSLPDVQVKRDTVKEHVTDDMLKEVIDVHISETDSISLLDIPNTSVSVDADDAEAIM